MNKLSGFGLLFAVLVLVGVWGGRKDVLNVHDKKGGYYGLV